MSYLELTQIEKYYDSFHALKNIDLQVEKEEFVVFVGPSGCGKSTLLRSICGLETVSSGKIVLDGQDITYVHPSKRNLAMVFQNYALFPHLNVFNNIAFGLQLHGVSKQEIRQRVERVAALLHLEGMLDRKPKQLSGGQRQRVAIGRCIVKAPKLFLFDEPLSNLDAKLRVRMRVELLNLHYETRNTVVYVTHDQVEAMTMADKIVVLQDGRIEQFGSPMTLYERPVNKFVAGFIGSPQMNFLPAKTSVPDANGLSCEVEGARQAYASLARRRLEAQRVDHSRRSTRAYRIGRNRSLDGGQGGRQHRRESRRRDLPSCRNCPGRTAHHGKVARFARSKTGRKRYAPSAGGQDLPVRGGGRARH